MCADNEWLFSVNIRLVYAKTEMLNILNTAFYTPASFASTGKLLAESCRVGLAHAKSDSFLLLRYFKHCVLHASKLRVYR
ncbi:hypothetical protein CWB66_18850 [Pseudoalteromonas sp. S558]|nr:hypothetical protein CWB66_18850 [Pseudoalteromonas sp. S558]